MYDGLEIGLFGYHVLLCAAVIAGITLFSAARRGLPKSDVRSRMACTPIQNLESVHALLAEAATLGGPNVDEGCGLPAGFQRHLSVYSDKLTIALGRCIHWTRWLKVLRGLTCILIAGGVVVAAREGVGRLAIERASSQWAYLWSIDIVLTQAFWGLPVLALIYLLHAYCEAALSNYHHDLGRLLAAEKLKPRHQ
jgi:hypothetical protein